MAPFVIIILTYILVLLLPYDIDINIHDVRVGRWLLVLIIKKEKIIFHTKMLIFIYIIFVPKIVHLIFNDIVFIKTS